MAEVADLATARIGRELLFASFFGNLSRAQTDFVLARLGADFETIPMRAGDRLWSEGDETKHVYFVSEGRIRARAEGRADWIYEGRWALGTTDITARRRRGRTMILERDTVAIRLPSETYLDLIEDSNDIAAMAIVGNARGLLRLYAELAPDEVFEEPRVEPRDHDETTIVGRTMILAEAALFRDASAQALSDLASIVTVTDLDAGETLFGDGRPPGLLHVLVRGNVEVARHEPTIVGRFGPGDTVAPAICIVDDRAWTGRAVTAARLLSFERDEWFDQMEDHPDMAVGAMGALSLERERLQERLAEKLGELVLR